MIIILTSKVQMSRHRKAHSNLEQQQATFMQDLEQSLLNSHDLYGIDAFEAVFNKKKLLNQMIIKQKKLKQDAHQSYLKAKQRVIQIQQLQTKVDKQTALLKSQVEKINDAHNMAKLLMMEKIVKLQREAQEAEKKRSQCYEARVQSQRSSLAHVSRNINKIQRARMNNLSRTLVTKEENQNSKYQTIQMNRRKAESVKLDRQRRQSRLKRIQEYKLQRAQKNYLDKIRSLQETIQLKQSQLGQLTLRQEQQESHLEAAQNVTHQYLNSFFATSATIQ